MNGEASSRQETLRRAVDEWSRRLVSLDGRNRMLYFRELSRGTLEVSPGAEGIRTPQLETLLAGDPVQLSDLFTPEALPAARLRVRALAAKAKSNFEEKGLATLFIGYSFASWKRPDGRSPRAPVVMIPLRIVLEGAAGDDAVIEVRGPAEVNLPFVYAIRRDAGTEPYPEIEQRSADYRDWPGHIVERCRDVPEFSVDDRFFIANLEFSKLPMVVDMEQHRDELLGNDLVAALAGHEPARDALKVPPDVAIDLPDHTVPQEDFLVCDADASQNYTIVAALQGHSLAIHGPPGTGKSQTIANLISSLAANGKTVLFVAEKRAAIAAVTRRLDEAGCGDLVLDLHDGSARRTIARSLAASIESVDQLLAHTAVDAHGDFVASRKKLVAHRRQMHQKREPMALSFSVLQSMVGTPDGEVTGLRLSVQDLEKFTEEGRADAKSLLAQWRGLTKRLDEDPTGMWSTAELGTSEEATAARKDVEDLVEVLIPAVENAYRDALADVSLPASPDVSVDKFAEVIATINELYDRYTPEFLDNAPSLAEGLRPAERSAVGRLISRIFNPSYRSIRRSLQQVGFVGADQVAVLSDARRANEAQEMWSRWYRGARLPSHVEGGPALVQALRDYHAVRDRLVIRVPELAALDDFGAEDVAIRAMLVHRNLADARADLARVVSEIGAYGLRPLLRAETEGGKRSDDLGAKAMRVFAATAIDAITWQEPELATFDGARHQKVAERFAELDAHHVATTSHRVMRVVAAGAAEALQSKSREAALVRHEAAAKSHHMPIRQLISRAPTVVKALRPCWAMSPLLVSRMLPATPNLFDVVIFDEASQVLPIDAIPAIARAAQVVVSGDPLQLPPSQFVVSDSSEDQEREQGTEAANATVDAESILDVMRNLLVERNLRWHYRSQDERLINFSNMVTYDRSLVSFPGTNRGTGVKLVLIDGLPETAEQTASNPAVVSRVVELIMEHAKDNPDESLGVIAMGRRHANALTEALRLARSQSEESYDGFFEDKGAEPFFIKVMEQAQGDERDHIILSVGYGRNPQGDMVYRWGALTRKGGERRLNVAVTRAKRHMTVVSSVAANDIDPTRTRSRGAALLAQYLEYAERGGESIPGRDPTPELTRFETSVRDRLTAAGIPLEPHHGMGRLRIDFAAFGNKSKTRPVLAIETDGVGYNSSDTARDRDRLRPEVLRKRGWRYHRIWSIDWYRDPESETAKVVAAWEGAVAETKDRSPNQLGHDSLADRPVVAGRGRSPVAITGAGILDYSRAELVRLILWIQSDGITRTDDELMAEAMEVLGFKVANHRIKRALGGAIAQAKE